LWFNGFIRLLLFEMLEKGLIFFETFLYLENLGLKLLSDLFFFEDNDWFDRFLLILWSKGIDLTDFGEFTVGKINGVKRRWWSEYFFLWLFIINIRILHILEDILLIRSNFVDTKDKIRFRKKKISADINYTGYLIKEIENKQTIYK